MYNLGTDETSSPGPYPPPPKEGMGLGTRLGTEAAVAVTGEVSFGNRNKHQFET